MRTLCEVDVDGRPLLASGGRDGVVRLWDLENRGARVASLTGHRGWVYGLCTVRVSGPRPAGLGGPGRRDTYLGPARRPAGAHDRHRPPEGVDHRPVSGADGRANAARGRARQRHSDRVPRQVGSGGMRAGHPACVMKRSH
ncbi:hypothetical protein [Streptomyces umbrinus]|uniref:hypothetical protein n=1 Tax=Streptomyces umbrinus TaxID=67370 RepID=UPI00359419CA